MMRQCLSVTWVVTCFASVALPARAQPNPATAEPALTSYQLIDRALEGKRIDEETAHKFRVFAAFGDSRLPTAYRGAVSGAKPPRRSRAWPRC